MRNLIITAAVSAALGAALALWLRPTPTKQVQVEQQVRTEYQVKEVERIIKQPGGVEVIERVVTKNGTSATNTNSQTSESKRPDWVLGLGVGSKLLRLQPVYVATVQRRMFGPIFAGAYGRTDSEFGLLLSMEF